MEDFLEELSSASRTVTQLATWATKEKRLSPGPIDTKWVQEVLNELWVVSDEKTLDVKLREIDSYLAEAEATYQHFIKQMSTESDGAMVKWNLNAVIVQINRARRQLSCTFLLLDEPL